MPSKKLPFVLTLTAVLTLTLTVLLTAVPAAAQQYKVLLNFNPNGGAVGSNPGSPLIFDAAGNLYGSTSLGGAYSHGAMFELVPQGAGRFSLKVLHQFGRSGDGYSVPGVILDGGNLYGTTYTGGANFRTGTVFELSPRAQGVWSESILYNFDQNGTDGYNPGAGLVSDGSGNFYGTTIFGGTHGVGTVFELSPGVGGSWTETTLYSFGSGTDGQYPIGLIRDGSGNLYGTTPNGGVYGVGTVFELSPAGGGSWTESFLYSFNPNTLDGWSPTSGLVFDAAGNLYGTTSSGGAAVVGAVFELSPATGGGWTESVIHSFESNGIDGVGPAAGLTIDAAGNLYGDTLNGGANGWGTVFAMVPKAGGGWNEKVLHSFNNNGVDGYYPATPLALGAGGILFGTTLEGGIYVAGSLNGGVSFAIKP